MIPLFGLIIGILIGIFIPYSIPEQYSSYVAVAILAALDSVFGVLFPPSRRSLIWEFFCQAFSKCSFGCRTYLYRGQAWNTNLFRCDICFWKQTVFKFCCYSKISIE